MKKNEYFYGDSMSKWKRKKNIWKVKKAIKGNCKKHRGRHGFMVDNNLSTRESSSTWIQREFKKDVPENFSLIENTEETLSFFSDVINEVKEKHYKEKFFFNLKGVKNITIDAIMYLLAIMGNLHSGDNVRFLKQSFSGNDPDDLEVYNTLLESGFYNYVSSNKIVSPVSSNRKIEISEGDTVDVRFAKSICDFVNAACGTLKSFTYELYEVLIEMMANTVQHAYMEDEIWAKHNWYVFVEDKKESVQFTFLDIGEGIPATINKRFFEKTVFSKKTDAEYIVSALDGQFRSQTKKESRGKGLPTVKTYAKSGEIEEMFIISGKGICIFKSNNNSIIKKDSNIGLDGTLFYWRIKKQDIEGCKC